MTVHSDEIVCAPRAGNVYDVLELILDRGMVIDVFVRVSLVGIEILKIDARIVVASVDTYLRFAEACNRLDLESDPRSKTVPELFGGPVAKTIGKAGAKRTARSLTDKVRDVLSPEAGTPEEEAAEAAVEEETAEPARRPARKRRSDDDRPRPRRRAAEEE
ncbi:gas vesicle structural protein GvpA [Streptomyces sp. SS1-1]|uniref:gas vesicle structural protein GvpA n=1 Tax=Streptomyces sp. SS1-1 TaxID=2651869 RepID=UPI00125057E3|nr:gas vesicle structural protein GvpA [Streptomyces sp. SS1-1]KAB2976173.1 gas vesicle structural protein GvpA [Streptomyces sp. SS1-1]